MAVETCQGDRELADMLGELLKELENYKEVFSELCSILDKSCARLNAMIDPTPQNKIRAVSAPSIESIALQIAELGQNAKGGTKAIVSLLNEIDSAIRTSKMKCGTCDKKGEIPHEKYSREDGIVQAYKELETCPTCHGKGEVEISDTAVHLASELMKGLKVLVI